MIFMMENIEELIKKSEKILPSEDLFIEAIRDLMKDEIKSYLREKMKENPQIREIMKEAMLDYIDAKIKESESVTKITKALGELGVITLPPEIKEKIIQTIYGTFKKEIDEILEKTL